MSCYLKISILFSLLTIAACGKEKNNDSHDAEAPQREETEGDIQDKGHYRVILRPMNIPPTESSLSAPLMGTAVLQVRANHFLVRINADLNKGGKHKQGIIKGPLCPMNKVPFLIPLDGDLSTQLNGLDTWPRGPIYRYQKEAKFDNLMKDLRARDYVGEEEVVKLGDGERLELASRSLVIYETVNEIDVPMACGKIIKVADE